MQKLEDQVLIAMITMILKVNRSLRVAISLKVCYAEIGCDYYL